MMNKEKLIVQNSKENKREKKGKCEQKAKKKSEQERNFIS